MKTKITYVAWLLFLFVLIGAGVYAYSVQLSQGLVVTGMRDTISWGLYISNFIFFVGLAAGGVVIYASVYLLGAKKFEPLSKIAAALAALSTMLAMVFIIPDIGRPDRLLNMITSPNTSSLLVVDFGILSAYLILCLVDLFLLIKGAKPRIMIALSALSLPFAIGIHSVTALLLGVLSARPFWNTGILAPVFISSAIVSSLGLLIVVTILTSKFAGFVFPKNLTSEIAKILAVVIPIDLFLLGIEIITVSYAAIPEHITPIMFLLAGPYSAGFYAELIFGIVAFFLLVHPSARKSSKILMVASLLAIFGIWLKRFNLLVPGLTQSPTGGIGTYTPTWVEYAVIVGIIAFGVLVFTLMLKLLPLKPKEEQ